MGKTLSQKQNKTTQKKAKSEKGNKRYKIKYAKGKTGLCVTIDNIESLSMPMNRKQVHRMVTRHKNVIKYKESKIISKENTLGSAGNFIQML